jgi:hypothetical protein
MTCIFKYAENSIMNTFKHSGATGDLIYSMAVMKHFGGGHFYLHLNQMDWIGQHYYGSLPTAFHQGRLTQQDFEYMRDFMLAQEYVTGFDVLDPQTHEITHNLDRFRPLFVGHPGNYIDIYSTAFGIQDPDTRQQIRNTPWLTVPSPTVVDGRTIVVNRTERWLPPEISPQWALWQEQGLEQQAIFVGLPQEYDRFRQDIGWDIPYCATKTMLELASVIAGAEAFIGNQSQALALAIGLGIEFGCEARQDLPIERNECYFGDNPRGNYF